jgi:hypothetical protein
MQEFLGGADLPGFHSVTPPSQAAGWLPATFFLVPLNRFSRMRAGSPLAGKMPALQLDFCFLFFSPIVVAQGSFE